MVVLELIGREMVALVDAGVVLGTEFVLDAVHLVLVSAKVPAALDPAVLTAHHGHDRTNDCRFADVRTESRPERVGAATRRRTHADFMEQPVPHN